MKIETSSGVIEAVGLGEGKSFTMDATPAAFALLSSGLYTNKIRAVLREVGCNAVDAHKLNGNDDLPIEVKLPNRLDSSFFIRDFGPGLSHDDILSLYSTYFKSLKAKDNNMIGGFGVGSKSPFAYTDTFTVISIHNGEQRVYTAFIGEQGIPEIHQMGEAIETDKASGLQIGFPVKPADVSTFEKEAVDVFSAFPVRPKILGVTLNFADYETSQWVEDVYTYKSNPNTWRRVDHSFTVNMGGVRYPLNEFSDKARQANKVLSPMADALLNQGLELRVKIGSLSVAASREALQYDPRTMENLTNILNGAADDLVKMLIKKIESVYDSTKPAPVNAKAFRELLTTKGLGFDSWKHLPWSSHKLLRDRPEMLAVFTAAVSGNFEIDMKQYPHVKALRVTQAGYQAYQKLEQNYDINAYKERRKMIVGLRRQLVDDRTDVLHTITRSMNDESDLLTVKGSLSPETLLSAYASDKMSRYNTNIVLLPVHEYETKRGVEVPVEPTADQIKAFEKDVEALKKEFELKECNIPLLAALPAPPKTKKEKTVWTIPVQRYLSDVDVRKTLRGLPSSGVAIETSEETDDEIAYMVYDRKSEQVNGGRTLIQLAREGREISSYLDQLNRYGMPTKVVLVAKEHFNDFLELHPNAVDYKDTLASIKKDPDVLKDCTAWIASRPEVATIGHREHKWKNIYEIAKDKGTLLDGLLHRVVSRWEKLDSSKYDSSKDTKNRDFYAWILNTSIPPLKAITLEQDVSRLNLQYPYIQYFEYSTPDAIKQEYIRNTDLAAGRAAGKTEQDLKIPDDVAVPVDTTPGADGP